MTSGTKPAPAEVVTAFLVIKRADGSFYATTALDTPLNVARTATTVDVKHGCRDLTDAIRDTELTSHIVESLQPQDKDTASSILQALSDRGIL